MIVSRFFLSFTAALDVTPYPRLTGISAIMIDTRLALLSFIVPVSPDIAECK